MSMYALLRENAANRPTSGPLTDVDVETNFDGNLCRCTGYRPILDAFKGLVKHENDKCQTSCVLGDACCKVNGNGNCSGDGGVENGAVQNNDVLQNGAIEPEPPMDKEFIFPPELIKYEPHDLDVAKGRWFRPTTLRRFMELKTAYPSAKVIIGNTELGIEAKFKDLKVSTLLCATHVPELNSIVQTEHGVEFGSSVNWSQFNSFVDKLLAKEAMEHNSQSTPYKLDSLRSIQSQLRWFAGKQIRNVAAIGGNIVTASPISDVNPLWIAARATFVVLDCNTGHERSIAAKDFFLSYRKVDLKPDEVLLKVAVPWNETPLDTTYAFKTARRRDDDIAIVSAGIRLTLERTVDPRNDEKDTSQSRAIFCIADIVLSFGGLAPKTVSLDKSESSVKGQPFTEDTLNRLIDIVAQETTLEKDVPGGMPEFRQSLALGFVFKAFVMSASNLSKYCEASGIQCVPFSTQEMFASIEDLSIPDEDQVSRGSQISSATSPQSNVDQTGKSVKHLSAVLQVSGEAKYLDDVKPTEGELQGALVLSSESHARILSMDVDEASEMPGVHRVVTVKDITGDNTFGPIVQDELCFAEDTVTTMGQVIGVVVAETQQQAKEAAKAVRISYERLTPVLSIEEAIKAESFAPGVPPRVLRKGNVIEAFSVAKNAGNIVEGTVRIGAQEHWYLEPHGTIAVPDENGEMMILASTQAPSKTQAAVARVLGEPMHKVVCKAKRLGGAFGGKETRSLFVSVAAAVAAQVTQKPVRLILDRDTDMLTTGTRHAFLGQYKASYETSGKITALHLRTFHNMGNCQDLSIPVLDRSLLHVTNCYDIANVDVVGRACLTHTASSTAFRGFGGPQGMMIAENVVEHVAWATGKPPELVRELNMFGSHGNSSTTPFKMTFNSEPLVSCWKSVLADSSFKERRKSVDAFNEHNRLRKRGISAVPTTFGISFTWPTYNQAGALVHIYHNDGSVLISHGGVEMGQGLHTKICQVAATALGLPLDQIFISETATDKVPNASPTAASSSSDLYGMAVQRACEELKSNLAPCRKELGPSASWNEIVSYAWFNRVSLSATGFYRTPSIDMLDLGKPGAEGRPFFYYTNGAAVSEVEVDVLTGESQIIRTDIAMDIGRPLNPAIDIGQIEGAFVQGLGWCTMEEIVRGSATAHAWLKPGDVTTLGPGTYKLPGFSDIPKDFRVRVLETRNDVDTIHSSKGTGEPPLFLAASVFYALRDAIRSSRLKHGRNEWFELDSPATVERIRLALADDILNRVIPKGKDVKPQLSL